MDPLKLLTFLDLSETLSYTETAERLFVSQATVSKHIMSLEKELGINLFARTPHSVALTPAGQKLIPLAQQVVDSNEELLHGIDEIKDAVELTLNIRTIPSIGQYSAFNLITEFAKVHPEVHLNFAEAEGELLIPSIRNHTADVVFMRIFNLENCKYDHLVQETDQFSVLMNRNHPLATQKSITLSALQNEAFLQLDESTNLFDHAMRLIDGINPQPEIKYKGKRLDLILDMIKNEMGVSVVMEKSVSLSEDEPVVSIPLVPTIQSVVAFVRPLQNHSKASQLFWQFIQE